jgi:hypothetical protein
LVDRGDRAVSAITCQRKRYDPHHQGQPDESLRRREVFALDLNCVSAENAYVVVWGPDGPWTDRVRAVPFTEAARKAVADWLEYRLLLGADHDRPWVALHAAPNVGQPMKVEAFDALLRTYVGDGWSLKRLRDTGAVRWVNRGMGVEHLRQLLGQSAIEDTLPYAQLASGDVERAGGAHRRTGVPRTGRVARRRWIRGPAVHQARVSLVARSNSAALLYRMRCDCFRVV